MSNKKRVKIQKREIIPENYVPAMPKTMDTLIQQIQFTRKSPFIRPEDRDVALDEYLIEVARNLELVRRREENMKYFQQQEEENTTEKQQKRDVKDKRCSCPRWGDYFWCCCIPNTGTLKGCVTRPVSCLYLTGIYGLYLVTVLIAVIYFFWYRK